MRNGRFERSWGPDGKQVYRVRWDEALPTLSRVEMRRLEFLRYLISVGRISESSPPQP